AAGGAALNRNGASAPAPATNAPIPMATLQPLVRLAIADSFKTCRARLSASPQATLKGSPHIIGPQATLKESPYIIGISAARASPRHENSRWLAEARKP